MADLRNGDPINQVLAIGAPYPMVVLPADGEYWLEGNYHVLSRDDNDRPIYPSLDMSRCMLTTDENVYNYRQNFAGKEHINYAGEDLSHGPILMSVLLDLSVNDSISDQFLVLLRMKNKTIFKAIPITSLASDIPGPRDFMRYILVEEPEVDRFHPIAIPRASDEVMRFDEHTVTNCHKVGVLYQTFGQTNEEDFLQNQEISPAFREFLDLIGEQVNLKDFTKYRGGLDVKYGQTGDYSYYTNYKNRELMFHVSPLLPYTPNDSQQLSRKRHIGNDVVTIIFQETNTPFSPASIRSHVLHVFIVVQVENPNTEDTCYKVSVTAKEGVPKFAPILPKTCIFKKGPEFRSFLLTKMINGEMAALKCEKFLTLGERTRSSLLEQVVSEMINKNERLMEDEHCIIEYQQSTHKSNSFLSTFRSAWNRNGRTTSHSSSNSSETFKASKNQGQSLSLNDLTSLDVEDHKKDLKISNKEKKKAKKEKRHVATNLVSIMKASSFNVNIDLNSSGEFSPSPRPRSTAFVEMAPHTRTALYGEQVYDASSFTNSLPRNLSLRNGYTCAELHKDGNGSICEKTEDADHSSSIALAAAQLEIEKLKAEVSKLKMDLDRHKMLHQREIKKLNDRYSNSNATRDDVASILKAAQNRKEKRKSAYLLTPTEFV